MGIKIFDPNNYNFGGLATGNMNGISGTTGTHGGVAFLGTAGPGNAQAPSNPSTSGTYSALINSSSNVQNIDNSGGSNKGSAD